MTEQKIIDNPFQIKPSFWNLVFDEPVGTVNGSGTYVQAYADNFAILVGK